MVASKFAFTVSWTPAMHPVPLAPSHIPAMMLYNDEEAKQVGPHISEMQSGAESSVMAALCIHTAALYLLYVM
jgi:hypothetical protein